MAIKKYFDGTVLIEVTVPDAPLPGVLAVNNDHLSPLNPNGADPALIPVDLAQLPNLRPTDGAVPSLKFPDPLPGKGEGAGLGPPSKADTVYNDPWANNPARDPGTVADLQSGPLGSAVGQTSTERRLQDAWLADRPKDVDTARANREADFARRMDVQSADPQPTDPQPAGQVGQIHSPRPEQPVELPEGEPNADPTNAQRMTDDRQIGGADAGSEKTPGPAEGEMPDESWTKVQLGEYIAANGKPEDVPADTELKAVFLAKAQDIAATKNLA